MESIDLIDKIKSLYIFKNIFNYIKDTNIQLKLFIYSNYYHNKLNLKYTYYKEKYLKNIGFKLDRYLNIKQDKYEKNILTKKYDKLLLDIKFNKERFENNIYEILESKKIKDIDEEDINKIKETLINIDSPLFAVVSKTQFFEKNCTIYISQKNIDDYNLKDDYRIFFDKLNKSNVNYSSIYYIFNNKNKINYLNEFNIDFNKIKRISLIEDKSDDNKEDEEENNIFETLFSFNSIKDNLIYLKIDFKSIPKIFKKIDNFKSLKYLYMNSLEFDEDFNIKSSSLKLLSLNNCKNIIISNIFCQNLKKLDLGNNNISCIDLLENVNFSELNVLDLSNNKISNIEVLKKVQFKKLEILNLTNNIILSIYILKNVNFKELKELNLSFNKIDNIKVLDRVNFEKLEIINLGYNRISNYINILQRVNFKELKELYLFYNYISDIEVLERVKFEKLEILDLRGNNLLNKNILDNTNFKNLKQLSLFDNDI